MNARRTVLGATLAALAAGSSWGAVRETSDPSDGRHVALTVLVTREGTTVEAAAVRPGVARGALAGSSRLRVRTLDAAGNTVREVGFPDPLSVRVYRRAPVLATGDGDASSSEWDAPVHETIERDEARVTIVVPLTPALAAVEVGWTEGKAEPFDLRDVIAKACAEDGHEDCRAWRDAHPPGK